MYPTAPARSSANDGRALEEAIGAFFKVNGYEVELNVVREGRSGGRHEIDVLAVKRDALTTFTVAVECKSWQHPVEKDVVSKLDYVMKDLVLNKGIVVSTGGFRSGAGQAADQLAIDLWGPDELRQFLGSSSFAALELQQPVVREAVGWPFQLEEDPATKTVRSNARGTAVLRRGKEEVIGLHRTWVPVHLARLTVAEPNRKWGRESLTSRAVTNLYEALGGRFLVAIDDPPQRVDLAEGSTIPPLVKESKVGPAIVKAYERARAVTTEVARARHAAILTDLGVPTPCRGVTVDAVELAYYPVWVGVLRIGSSERLLSVSGRTGNLVDILSRALTTNITHVRPWLA